MKILDIKLTYRCNNNCKYCCQDRRLRNMTSDLSLQDMKKILNKEKERGTRIDKVVLTGGELTLNKELLDIIDLIKEKGITDIQFQTNARNLCDSKLCRVLINKGIKNFGISLHGSNDEIHEKFTGIKGSFKETIKALENLKQYDGINVTLNTVVTKLNINNLGDIIQLVEQKSYAKNLQFAFIHITGEAINISENLVKIAEAAEYIKNAIIRYCTNKIGVFTEAIPFCLMRGQEKRVAELQTIKNETITWDKFHRIEFSKVQKSEFKIKGEVCKSGCLFYGMCEGTWKEYPELYGFDEFKPVKEI